MRKEFPVNIESEEEWIDLPQGTHIHPKEVEKMFDDEEMGEGGREYAASIRPEGNIVKEVYGTNRNVKFSGMRTYDDARESIFTHSHPKFLLKQELDEGVISIPPFSPDDLENYDKEIRAFSQTTDDSSSGQIHSFKSDDEGTKKDINKRKKLGGYLLHELKELVDKHQDEPKFKRSMRSIEGFPMSANMYTASEFNLARRGAGDAAVIKVRKSEDPKKVYITGIRSTHKEEPQYDLLQTLPRKKKPVKPLINRLNLTTSIKATGFGLVNLNLNGLSSMLVGSKKKKTPIKKQKKK
jgi:hypothetical protein